MSRREVLAPLRAALLTSADGKPPVGPKPEEISEFTAFLLMGGHEFTPAFIMRLTAPEAVTELLSRFGEVSEQVTFPDTAQTYERWKSKWFNFRPDPLTVVFSPEEPTLRRCLAAGKQGATTTNWAPTWQRLTSPDAAAVANTSLLRGTNFDLARVLELR